MRTIGGFDERTFLYYEEDILAEKVCSLGLKNAVLRDFWIKLNHQEKEASLESERQRLFHMRCEFESRCLYLKEYSGYRRFLSQVLMLIWKFDAVAKRRLVRIVYWAR